MQKIITKEDQEKKDKRNKTILGIVLGALLILSTAGYAFYQSGDSSSSNEKITYHGIKFSLMNDGLWHFTVNGIEYATSYNPSETESVSSQVLMSLGQYQGQEMYFNYDNNIDAEREVSLNLARFASRAQKACYGACEVNLPEVNCSENMIIIQEVNITPQIKQENKCIFIQAPEESLIKTSDKFIFEVVGI